MKASLSFLTILFLSSCAAGKERAYTASTPADPIVRQFLGISLTDSVDFIRWNFTFNDLNYKLQCNYGVGKPNTNGFYDEGKKIELTGKVKSEGNYYSLFNGTRTLRLVEFNNDLLHLVYNDNKMLKGNGGWSYVLNNINATVSNSFNLTAQQTALKDSMSYEGRTPCGIPRIVAPGAECYKLKWLIIFYADSKKNEPTTYRILGTPWRKEGGRTGTWKIIKEKDNRIRYLLLDEKGNILLTILKVDENVILFTDANGNLLVGDHNFSYTLNRRF